jgi:hypothetical protein
MQGAYMERKTKATVTPGAVIAQSVWCWATGWTMGVLVFDSRRGLGIVLFTTAFRTALGPTQPPIQWVPGTLSLGIQRPGREADHSPPYSAEVKECVELYLHSPNTPPWCGAQLKHRDNFTFTFYSYSCARLQSSRRWGGGVWNWSSTHSLPWH